MLCQDLGDSALDGTYIYKCSFFPQTIRDCNFLVDSMISAAECGEDSLTKFTSLLKTFLFLFYLSVFYTEQQ